MNKIIVVLDTNIFISSVFWNGAPYLIMKKCLDGEIIAFISKDIISEIKKVLKRDFFLCDREIEDVVDALILFANLIKTTDKVDIVKDDPEDNRILECALACKAEYIITQDRHLLKLKSFEEIEIINPLEFLERLKLI